MAFDPKELAYDGSQRMLGGISRVVADDVGDRRRPAEPL
jgi:hypothetical protein